MHYHTFDRLQRIHPPLLYIALLKAILCVIIGFYNRKRNPNTIFLIAFLCLLILLDINALLQAEGRNGTIMLILFVHTAPFSFLQGPFLYFYVRNTLKDQNRLNRSDLIHFIPFLLVCIDHLPYFQLPLDEKRKIIDLVSQDMSAVRIFSRGRIINHFQYSLLRWAIWAGYLGYILYMLYLKRPGNRKRSNVPFPQYQMTYTWLLTLTLSFMGVLLPFLKVILDFHSGRIKMDGSTYLSTPAYIISMIIYVMACLSILLYPQILYGMPRSNVNIPEPDSQAEIIQETTLENDQLLEKMMSSEIVSPEDPFLPLATEIEKYIVEGKKFLDPDFSISSISREFNVPQHHIHYCFSKIIRTSFPTYRNRLRINHAKELLARGHGTQLTFEAIGKMSGFVTKMNFYTAFRKETGMTPKQYIEALKTGQIDESISEE